MYPTRHAQARDRRHWQATSSGLVADEDGCLSLARLPSLSPPLDSPGPWGVESSGLAAAACCSVFVADARRARVLYRDGLCQDVVALPGPGGSPAAPLFVSPRGVAVNRTHLAVADAGQGAVLVFAVDDLRLQRLLRSGLTAPVAVAFATDGGLFVLDSAPSRLVRFTASGVLDAAFAATAASAAADPSAFAVTADGHLWVVDRGTRRVIALDAAGAATGEVITGASDWQPNAIAVHGDRVFVADAGSGRIGVFEALRWLGDVPGYRGPVSALAVGDEGQLFIKSGDDESVAIACADTASVTHGEVLCGPWDAGERDGWERVAVDATLATSTTLQIDVYTDATPAAPAPHAWVRAPSNDLLLASLVSPSLPIPSAPMQRFVWVRVRLSASPTGASPRLEQIRAATADEDYRTHLPSVFSEVDGDATLQRLLALARSEVGDGEVAVADLARTFSPQFLPAASLPWLAGWLAFALPDGLEIDARRALLARVHELYRRRGTLSGLLEFLHLYTGVRARIIEPFRHRHLWQLDGDSALGFDTGLPPAAADGMLVADSEALRSTDPAWGCAPERVVVGHAIVGVDRPVERGDLGSVLFDDQAHRITVVIPAGQANDAATRRRIREIIDAEAPAHVLCDVCFIEPQLRIGLQASLGVDTIVAGEGAPLRLAQSHWSLDAHLGGAVPGVGIGQPARIGSSLVLG